VTQVVIAAGGLGTRLGPLTAHRPKVLVPVGGRVFLDIVLDQLAGQGIERVHLCAGHHADQVVRHLGGQRRHRPRITMTAEPRPLGTAGCLRLALPFLDDRFVLLLGDTYTPISFGDVLDAHERRGRPALMAVLRNRDALETSNVDVRDGIVVAYDKQVPPGTYDWVDYGVAALERDLVATLPASRSADLAEVYQPLIAQGRLAAYEVGTRFWEIGSPDGHAELDTRIRTDGLPDGSEPVAR
jgi:NDP-sugar pyrophosphorylase family protein